MTVRTVTTCVIIAAIGTGLTTIAMTVEPYGQVGNSRRAAMFVAVDEAELVQAYEVSREFLGMVEARKESDVGFELAGELAEVLVDEGAHVRQGQILARLDTSILEADRAVLVAALNESRATLEFAEVTRMRRERLLTARSATLQEFDEADKKHDGAVAAVARAEAAVRAVDTRIARSTIRAPFDALVGKRYVDEGRIVGAGDAVLGLLEDAPPEVRIGVVGLAIEQLQVGQKCSLLIRDEHVAATVKAILPIIRHRTRSADVILVVDDGGQRPFIGDTATLSVKVSKAELGFWLPITCLTESSRGLWSCYALVPLPRNDGNDLATHSLRKRELEVVHVETDRVFVRGTLCDGELVVTEGLQRLVQFQRVRIASEHAATTTGLSP